MISILTPTYNHEDYIENCLNSVLNQTYTDWELLILDDGSTDSTPLKINKYLKKNKRIHYFKMKHGGPENLVNLYNFGLYRAKGNYIAILEGDDFWPENKLSYQISNFRDDVALSFGKCTIVDRKLNTKFVAPVSEKIDIFENRPVHSAFNLFFKNFNFISAVTVIIRKKALEEIGGFKSSHGMVQVDFTTWCYLALYNKFQFIPQNLGYWLRHEESITSSKFIEMNRARIKFLNNFYEENKNLINKQSIRFNITEELNNISNELIYQLQIARQELILSNYGQAKEKSYHVIISSRNLVITLKAILILVSALIKIDIISLIHNLKHKIGS